MGQATWVAAGVVAAAKRGGAAAGPGGVVGQGDDLLVGQVGGFDLLGDAAFGDQVGDAGGGGAMSVASKPASDQPSPRMMLLLPVLVQRNAAR